MGTKARYTKRSIGTNMIDIMLVDDHPLMRKGVRDMIEAEDDMRVCCEAETANQAVRLLARHDPHIIIVDISLKGEVSGIDLIKSLAGRKISARPIILSMHTETFFVERAIRAGARGYLTKDEAPQTIIQAIREVHGGGLYVSASVSGLMISKLLDDSRIEPVIPIDELTDRELEVLRLIGEGFKSKDISGKLNLSVNTVETHRKNIKAKLGCDSSGELARHAIAWLHSRQI
ncbi:MAG: response regulator transcription factor [Spirochaetes bacterium]|nr:response regulator transcription factor [Spirochaetota bacterium]